MKIVLATCGSRGDVQPMIALCLGLKAKGHDVLLLGPPEKAVWARHLGCPYKAFGRDVTAFINKMKNAINPSAAMAFVSFVRQEIYSQFNVLPRLIKKADRVIGSSLVFGLSSIAQAMDIRYQYITFTPQLLKSGDHPFPALKTQNMPRFCNRLSWEIARLLDRLNLTFLINRHRIKLGLPAIDNAWDHILGDHPIVASDPQIAKVPLDVKKSFIQTGYLHLDLPHRSYPDLDRFLENGDKPIYAGFGSMPPRDQNKNIPLLIAAARSVGKRIIVSKFWEGPLKYSSVKDVFFIKNYPHLYLFPKTDTVIHHGGAGTTATAAISGTPQVIVPHILDQYYHGHKIYLAHLGPKPIQRSRLSKYKLTAALKKCAESTGIRQAARKTGKSIDRHASLALTIQAIEAS